MYQRYTLDEEGLKLPVVERVLENGEVVDRKRVRSLDFQQAMVNSADEWMLYESLWRSSNGYYNCFEAMFKYLEEYRDGDGGLILESLLDYVTNNSRDVQMAQLFRSLCEKLNAASLDPAAYNSVIRAMVSRLENVSDPSALLDLLMTLLAQAHFFDSPDLEVVKCVIGVVQTRVKEFEAGAALDEMWAYMSERTSKRVILEVAKPYLDDLSLTTPILPRNCAFYSSNSKSGQRVGILVERCRWDVNLTGDSLPQVAHPNLLFWFQVKDGNCKASVAAVKDAVLSGDSRLYRYPFSNVFDHLGCCWNIPEVKDIRSLESFPGMFLTGERNFHQYPGTAGKEYRELLTYLSAHEFDDMWLKDTGYKVADIM